MQTDFCETYLARAVLGQLGCKTQIEEKVARLQNLI